MKVSVILPSYNKPQFVLEAVESILNQSLIDWELWIIENSTDNQTFHLIENIKDSRIHYIRAEYTPEFRKEFYVPAYILNSYLDMLEGEYVFYLSDDDVIKPETFQKCIDYFEAHPDAKAIYFGMRSVREQPDHTWKEDGFIGGSTHIYEAGNGLDCVLDGGQVMFHKSLLKKLEKPYFATDWQNASHCDGVFLSRLNSLVAFYPINDLLLLHRKTLISTHNV